MAVRVECVGVWDGVQNVDIDDDADQIEVEVEVEVDGSGYGREVSVDEGANTNIKVNRICEGVAGDSCQGCAAGGSRLWGTGQPILRFSSFSFVVPLVGHSLPLRWRLRPK